jgi:hypothetical protein
MVGTNNTKLIREIKKLKKIRPRKDWVLLTKSQILGEETRVELFPFFRPVYASLFLVLFVTGLFEFSQDALPGDSLYYLKKITEKGQMIFCSEEEKPRLNLKLATKRLEELNKIAKENEVKKLAPAINEFQANVSEAAKNLKETPKINKEIVALTREIEEEKGKVEEVLGTNIETKDYDDTVAGIVEWQITELEKTSLTEEKQQMLEKAKEYFEGGRYSEALIEIYYLGQ